MMNGGERIGDEWMIQAAEHEGGQGARWGGE